nr:uncharacterized protein LOC117276233 isoform X3 [Nicotiana tomentosiformis]XP_033511479.1 uncharacterized protein LOC117276233 isoform X4 [Nicotiana tomentosiformis]
MNPRIVSPTSKRQACRDQNPAKISGVRPPTRPHARPSSGDFSATREAYPDQISNFFLQTASSRGCSESTHPTIFKIRQLSLFSGDRGGFFRPDLTSSSSVSLFVRLLGQPHLDMIDSTERSSYFSLESRKLKNMSFIKAASWTALELGRRCHRKLDVGQEPHFSVFEEHTLRRKGFLESCMIGSFSKWVGSPEAVRNWAAEAWNIKDELKISQLGDTQYLVRFVGESQASEILVRGNMWFDGNFLKLDR